MTETEQPRPPYEPDPAEVSKAAPYQRPRELDGQDDWTTNDGEVSPDVASDR